MGIEQKTRLIVAGVLCGLFVVLALVVELRGSMPGDEWVLTELDDALGTDLDDAMVGLGDATDTVPIAVASVVVVVALVATDRRSDAKLFLVVVVVTVIGNRLLKEAFARERPAIRTLPETPSTFSFPSGHASSSLAFVSALVMVVPQRWRRGVLLVGSVGIALVGFSRLVIGVHYPSDLLAAWLWVGAWIAAVSSKAGVSDLTP